MFVNAKLLRNRKPEAPVRDFKVHIDSDPDSKYNYIGFSPIRADNSQKSVMIIMDRQSLMDIADAIRDAIDKADESDANSGRSSMVLIPSA